ncbi:unnamed protein product [Paramecium sonneborni]|uniref:Uncharacterized protein n=1 Tax=Paramecium sonneborni TaxID=65129 RepID=A0A8S1N706_9CILI|nr:unnamed protein product [Paramecium sonneborni]
MNKKLLSQEQDEFLIETISFNEVLSLKNNHRENQDNNYTQYSQFVPKKNRQSTSMIFSIQAQEQFDLDELTKQPYFKDNKINNILETKSKNTHNTPSIKQIQIDSKFHSQNKTKKRRIFPENSAPSTELIKIIHPKVITPDEFKYTKKLSDLHHSESSAITLSNQNDSQTSKILKLEDKFYRLSQQNIATLNKEQQQKSTQLNLIKEVLTEVDEEQEAFFIYKENKKEISRFHYFLKLAPYPKRIVTFVQVIKKVGDIEICIGIEGTEQIIYFRRIKCEKAKLYNNCNIQVE